MTAAMTLSKFLLARIAEDEVLARLTPRSQMTISTGNLRADSAIADHVERWQPKRVLAECESKRRVIGLHEASDSSYIGWYGEDGGGPDMSACATCGTDTDYAVRWPCDTLRALALPYAAHSDYLPEWAL